MSGNDVEFVELAARKAAGCKATQTRREQGAPALMSMMPLRPGVGVSLGRRARGGACCDRRL